MAKEVEKLELASLEEAIHIVKCVDNREASQHKHDSLHGGKEEQQDLEIQQGMCRQAR